MRPAISVFEDQGIEPNPLSPEGEPKAFFLGLEDLVAVDPETGDHRQGIANSAGLSDKEGQVLAFVAVPDHGPFIPGERAKPRAQ